MVSCLLVVAAIGCLRFIVSFCFCSLFAVCCLRCVLRRCCLFVVSYLLFVV